MTDQPFFTTHDGTSQQDRTLYALSPDYVNVDERSTHEVLTFIKAFAKELKYIDEHNREDGDWSGFLGDMDPKTIADFLADPTCLDHDPDTRNSLTRPHRVLFFAFLELFSLARDHMNGLTKRHLDFFYRDVLSLSPRKGVPDQVYVLAELADRQAPFRLPRGTALFAGQDDGGKDIVFTSREDLFVSKAVVAEVKSLFVEKQVIDLERVRINPDTLIHWDPANKDVLGNGSPAQRAFLAMLMLALGDSPGEKPAPYTAKTPLTHDLLNELDGLLQFVKTGLAMSFMTFRTLMGLKARQENADGQWTKVNLILEKAAKKRLNDPKHTLSIREPADFETNLLAALNLDTFSGFFDTLPEVDDIYALNRHRHREDVIRFIPESLFMTVDDFTAMMAVVITIHGRWRDIYDILRSAARKIHRPCSESPLIHTYETDKFDSLVKKTLETVTFPVVLGRPLKGFDDCYARLIELESYFCMSAEQFAFVREKNRGGDRTHPWEWKQVYTIFRQAGLAKARPRRRRALKDIHKKNGFQAMIRFALGDPDPGDELPGKRDFLTLKPDRDQSYLTTFLCLEPAQYTFILSVHDNASAKTEEWDKVYATLESAQTRKRNWIPAEITRWKNLYAAPDATCVHSRRATDDKDTLPRWRTFGKGFDKSDPSPCAHPGTMGFALASPLLSLAEGSRTVTLTLTFSKEHFDTRAIKAALSGPSPFRVLLSSEKEMIPMEHTGVKILKGIPALEFSLTLSEQAPPVEPCTAAEGLASPFPVIRIMLADLLPEKDETDAGPSKTYQAFRSLILKRIDLKVGCRGLKGLTLQSDQGVIDPKKPFEPFGAMPLSGSGFYFAHPELCSKKIDRLSIRFDWMGAPDTFGDYYKNYTPAIAGNAVFKAGLKLFDLRSLKRAADAVSLFDTGNASSPHEVSVVMKDIAQTHPGYDRLTSLETADQVLNWSRYFKLELGSPDFLHSVYPKVAADCANHKVKGQHAPIIINPPYTPKLKSFTVGYDASLSLDLTTTDTGQAEDRCYHIEPFGYRDLTKGSGIRPFLPRFENQGELFIGIDRLKPPQPLSLLFQMDEGSADPDMERQPVRWDYLDDDTWTSLEDGRLLSDSTNGLLNSGIIRFNLPEARPGTLLGEDHYWLRVSIPQNTRSVADCVAIHTQALTAVFEDRGNDPGRLGRPLPAGSITAPVTPMPQIKAFHQPYSSFGGKAPEKDHLLYTRISERLRHKNRALTTWDYERMVLEAFPGIYKVKCLPAGTSKDPDLSETIQVIVIPDIKGKPHLDPFEPRLPADELIRIREYLGGYMPPSARIMVKNPAYIQLKIRLGVRLASDDNPGYDKKTLNRDLQRYLAPWAYDKSADIVFGGRINSSLIINFVEKRPYVDYVAHIKLFVSLDGGKRFIPCAGDDTDRLDQAGAPPDAILVSAPSHDIDLISREGYEPECFTGINYMEVELDFRIAGSSI